LSFARKHCGDLRWNSPVKGLLVGASRLEENLSGTYTFIPGLQPNFEKSAQPDWTNQFYGEYSWRKLTVDSEDKRYFRDHLVQMDTLEDKADIRTWYISGSYQLMKKLAVGSYYSHYTETSTFTHTFDTSLPAAHEYDKAISSRVDINRFWNVKLEGHFINGYAFGPYPNGFYPQQNPTFVPNTNALVLKAGFNF
jgi:hypothetical protein